jgi:putative transposase
VVKWSQRFRATGSAAAGKMGGHRPRVLVGEHRSWLLERTAGAGFTLRGLVAELAERGLKVDYRTVWNFVHAEGLSFKKNRSRRRAAKAGHRKTARLVEEISGQAGS